MGGYRGVMGFGTEYEQCQPNGWDDWREEAERGIKAKVIEGCGRPVSALGEIELPTGQKLVLGVDGRMWRRLKGAYEGIVPWEGELRDQWGESGDGAFLGLRSGRIPNTGVVRVVFDEVMANKGREVLVILATDEKGRWVAGVPEQEGTGAGVEVKDDTELTKVLVGERLKIIGTLHTHPGGGVRLSGTDEKLYARMNGVHIIADRDGTKVGIYVSVAGRIWVLGTQDVPKDVQGVAVEIVREGNRPLEELLKEPRRRAVVTISPSEYNRDRLGLFGPQETEEPKKKGKKGKKGKKRKKKEGTWIKCDKCQRAWPMDELKWIREGRRVPDLLCPECRKEEDAKTWKAQDLGRAIEVVAGTLLAAKDPFMGKMNWFRVTRGGWITPANPTKADIEMGRMEV